jgi:hypothetical protein
MDNDDNSSSGDSPLTQQMHKRNSLFGDELLNFDPDELDDDGWRDVFDDPTSDDSMMGQASGLGEASGANSNSGRSQRLSDAATSSSTTDETAAQAASTGIKPSGAAPDSGEGGGTKAQNGEKSSSKQPASGDPSGDEQDQDEEENESLTDTAWQNPEVDKPYREKMMQDM